MDTSLIIVLVVIVVGLGEVVRDVAVLVAIVEVDEGLELDVGDDGRVVGADVLVDVRLQVEHGAARLPEVDDLRLVRREALLEEEADLLEEVAALAAYRLGQVVRLGDLAGRERKTDGCENSQLGPTTRRTHCFFVYLFLGWVTVCMHV